jgi:hypothetical protein
MAATIATAITTIIIEDIRLLPAFFSQQCLYFFPLLQGHDSLRPTLAM